MEITMAMHQSHWSIVYRAGIESVFENSKGHGNSELNEVESHLIGVLEEPASNTSAAV